MKAATTKVNEKITDAQKSAAERLRKAKDRAAARAAGGGAEGEAEGGAVEGSAGPSSSSTASGAQDGTTASSESATKAPAPLRKPRGPKPEKVSAEIAEQKVHSEENLDKGKEPAVPEQISEEATI